MHAVRKLIPVNVATIRITYYRNYKNLISANSTTNENQCNIDAVFIINSIKIKSNQANKKHMKRSTKTNEN